MADVLLDGRMMTNRAAMHGLLKTALDFPAYYGNNLDALHDSLTDIDGPIHIIVSYGEALRDSLGSYGDTFLHMLWEIAEENNNISVTVYDTEQA